MNINEFVNERKEEWEKLEAIVDKCRAGRSGGLTRDELWDLSGLYTATVSDLSLLRSSPLGADPNNRIISYLNGLVTRAHGIIYRKAGFKWSFLKEFLVQGFPESIRKNWIYVLVSTGVFVGFGLAAFVVGLTEQGFIELVVPESIIAKVENGQVWFKDLYGVAPMASSGLMTHNISVTFLTFASGITFGIGCLYLLALNGLLLGAVAALCYRHDLSLEFWSFVLPHGSFELTAVFLAGAGGLILGHALIDPGPHRRSEFLAVRGREAVKLALGCVPLLVVAGLLEAFFSPSPLNAGIKLLLAAVLFSTLMALFALAGRSRA
jgi:uncharacterized membrane protein SpoIIM required for sporulation